MKKSTILALVILSGATFTGLGVLFTRVFPVAFLTGSNNGTLAALLAVSVAAAILVLGIFLGYLYRDSVRDTKSVKETVERFKKALGFEREERARLGKGLYEAKQTISELEDKLDKLASSRNNQSTQEQTRLLKDLEKLKERSDELTRELGKRKHRIADLMAEVSIAQAEAEMEKNEAAKMRASLQAGPLFAAPKEASLKTVLDSVIEIDGVHVALVADDYGLVVSSAGDGMPTETIAAISTLVADLGPKVSDILPMGEMNTISVGDDQGMVIETRFFILSGARCALAIARDEDKPQPGLSRKAATAIVDSFD